MKTTFSRTLFSLAAILLAALTIIGIAFQFFARDYMEKRALESLKTEATALSDVAAAYYQKDSLASKDFLVNLSVLSDISDADVVICDAEGKLVVCSEDPFRCQHKDLVVGKSYLKKVLSQDYVMNTGKIQGLYNETRYVVSMPIVAKDGAAIGIVICSTPTTGTLLVLRRLSDTFLFVSLAVVVIMAVVVFLYAKRHSNPLKQMSKAAVAFGHGNLKARVNLPKSAAQEVHELGLAFNNMAVSLEKSEYQRREFVANVSHELKTPMTTISGYVDGILDGTIPPQQQEHYLQIVSQETKRLSRLVRSMLDISRLQEQEQIPEEMKSRFEIAECIGQVLITFEQKILQKNLQVEVEFPEYPLYAHACQDYITQVIYNLTDNAVKFCPQGGVFSVRLQQREKKAYISIINDGQTIPAEELPLLFDRFHKLDKSRSENRDGWGLGLYIVKTIICSHGENIFASSKDGRTEFTFTLPLTD